MSPAPETDPADDLCVPANNGHAERLAKLAAIAADGNLRRARDAIGLAYAIGRAIGQLEGSERMSARWGESLARLPKTLLDTQQ